MFKVLNSFEITLLIIQIFIYIFDSNLVIVGNNILLQFTLYFMLKTILYII